MTASTTCQTDVGILPKDVITSGFIPSDMIACKAGQTSRRRTQRANADSELDSDSSAQASNLSIAVYNVTNRAENKIIYHFQSFYEKIKLNKKYQFLLSNSKDFVHL